MSGAPETERESRAAAFGRLTGWTEAARRLQAVASMHSDPERARNLYADAEILLAVNGKRDAVQPETPAQIAAQGQEEASGEPEREPDIGAVPAQE